MLHNSLYIAERLQERNNTGTARLRRDSHRFVRRRRESCADEGEMMLAGAWSIAGDCRTSGMEEAIADLSDFLRRMAVELHVHADRRIELIAEAGMSPESFRLEVRETRIVVAGRGIPEIWSGLVYAEKLMSMRGGPFLPLGERVIAPSFGRRIGQPPYGASFLVPHLSPAYLPDDAFKLTAHYGVNGMLIYGDWLCYVRSERFPELNHPEYERNIDMLRDAARRAMRYGIRLYYVPVGPKLPGDHPLFLRRPDLRGALLQQGMSESARRVHALCTSHEEVLRFHAEVMTNIAQEVKDLGGLILIVGGEAFKHCYMRADREGLPDRAPTNCPRCAARNPEEAVSDFVSAVSTAVHGLHAELDVIVWEYSAHLWTSDPDGMELIRQLPADASLLTTLDKGQWLQKDGYRKHIWDYSIEYAGPADRVVEQVRLAELQGRPCFIKTETAVGLECIQFPYLPALQRLGDKWERLKELSPAGVVQSWFFFGMWGSRAEELGWWVTWVPERSLQEVVTQIAERDFGVHGGRMVQVWRWLSEAVTHIPYIGLYFRGPQFLGPAHPLFFGDPPEDELSFYRGCWFLPEHEETFSRTVLEVRHSLLLTELPPEPHGFRANEGGEPWPIAIREYERVVELSLVALHAVQEIASEPLYRQDPYAAEAILEECTVIEAVHRTFLSTLNTLRFLHVKRLLQDGSPPDRPALLRQLKSTARSELSNAKNALKLYEREPWLDLSDRLEDGIFPSSTAMMRRKIASLREQLNEEE